MNLVYVVAYCDPQCERLAAEGLADQNYWPYLPMERYHSRRLRETAERPLFSRYLFVGVDLEGRQEAGVAIYRPITGTRGVRDILRRGDGSPGLIEAALIEEIRRAEGAGVFDQVKNSRLKRGSPAAITDGPFAGQIGKIAETSSRNRVKILFELLGREVTVSLPLALIKAL